MAFIESFLCYDLGSLSNLSVCVDLERVEAIAQSHLGDEYTLLYMASGERITINKPYNEVKAEFVRKLYRYEAHA